MDHKLFDHTILKADARLSDVDKVIDEAIEYGFAAVCVNSYYTKHVASRLKGTGVGTCTVIGFPLGQMSMKAKVCEALCAVGCGADELDMVINVAALKDGDYEYVEEEIAAVREACTGKILKVIIETCRLTDEEKVKASELAMSAGADFIKTSTGFSTSGATIGDVELIKEVVGDRLGVKASGGIRNIEFAQALVDAGATRLGTSATVAIIGEG